jgi:FtsZ-interacting cell division protein ZipA|tara:strand:+ start:1141 stop:1752 length:612 start_codon:yes stop_codon:yes gene_type:complete
MSTNSELYLIGLATLFFLVIVFLYVRKISNSGKLKVKIETVSNLEESSQSERENQQTFDFEVKKSKQELAILNLISVDKSFYEIEQVFGFLINYGGKINDGYFSFFDDDDSEKYRVINAISPGIFDEDTKTFAIVIVADLSMVTDAPSILKEMIEFSLQFTDKFYATLCDEERTPITKQMISHMESRAQDIARLKQLEERSAS